MPLMNAKPGEIWLADLGLAAKTRPVLIVSRFDPDAPRALLTYLPLTTQQRGSRYEIQLGDLPFLHQTSVVNVQGIGSLIEPRLERKLGQLSAATMAKVKDALRFALEL
jgi:mRNA interferase MazF